MSDEIFTAMGMPEGRNHFLKHFDVDMPTDVVRPTPSISRALVTLPFR